MRPRTLRPQVGESAAAWTRTVFAEGDYAGASMFGDAGTWQHHAALAMLRGDAAAFAALADFTDPEAKLHLGAARWIHGDAAGARQLLATVDLPHADNLLRLLQQPRIRVLSQLPWVPDAPTDLAGGAAHDAAFEVRNIGYHRNDAQNHPYAEVSRFLDAGFAPDFFVAVMLDWQHVPPDLQSLPCPLFGHIADHDLHAHSVLPWVHLYDELCVTDRTEWLDVQGLVRGRVSSFPKSFGLPGILAALPTGERHLDFFVSGTMLDPYHPDKAALLHELLSLPDIQLRVVRGFTGLMAYQSLLASSKASFTYVRRPGAMPTRGLESLAMGCAVAVQEESCLRLYAGDDAGTVAYGPGTRSLSAAVQTILGDWSYHQAAAARGAARLREQFAMPRVASQYLRFLTFRAAAPRPQRQMLDTSDWCQKRLSVSRGWLPANPAVRRRTMQANFRRLANAMARAPSLPKLLDMARELLTEAAFYKDRDQATAHEQVFLDDALGLLERGERLFPNALVPRFVRIRAMLHMGDPDARAQALQLAHDTIQRAPEDWQVDPQHDVLPFDFHPDLFDYRTYLDLVMVAAKGGLVVPGQMAQLLLACLAGYVARKTGKVALHEQVVRWNPTFARHRLELARALLASGGGVGRERAIGLLRELANGSSEFAVAARLLHDLQPGTASPVVLRHLDEDTLDANVKTRTLFDLERRPANGAQRGHARAKPSGGDPHLAVLVPAAGSCRDLAALCTDLACQVNANTLELIVAAPPDADDAEAMMASFRSSFAATAVVEVAADSTFAECLEACRRGATAPLLTIACAGDRFRPDSLALLADELQDESAVGLTFGNDGWTPRSIAHFDPSACTALTCWPTFGRLRLQHTNLVGLHPVWRAVLHERHGGFDASLGALAEHEFWRRATATCEVRNLRMLLASSSLDAGWRRQRDPALAAEIPDGFAAQRPLPAVLFASAIPEEAASHARLGIVDESMLRELDQVDAFYGTAMLHGDLATARRLLQTVVDNLPDLLSARLSLSRLLAATGLPGGPDLLAGALHRNPYADLVSRLLAGSTATREPPCAAEPDRAPHRALLLT